MKRRIGAILICMLLTLGIFAQADNSATVTQLPDRVPVDVYGTYVGNEAPDQHTAPLQEGAYQVASEDGSLTLIPQNPSDERELVVRFFDADHKEAMDWFKECIEGLNSQDAMPFEIYYRDKATGARIELDEEDEIRIKVSSEALEAYRLTTDGQKSKLDSTVAGGELIFKAGGSKCYFALADKKAEPDQPGPTPPDQPDTPDQPDIPDQPDQPETEPKPEQKPEAKPEAKPDSDNADTGDYFDLILWISLMVASASAFAIALLLRKRSKEE